MRGLKLGILMLAVVSTVTFGGYAAQATVSYQDPSVAARISELLAQIKWLQEELLKLQSQVETGTYVQIGSEFNLPQNRSVIINTTPKVTVKNISQIMCFTTPCPTAFNISVKEEGKLEKNVTVGYSKTKITDKLEMVFVGYDYDHESPYGTTIFKVTSIVTPPPAQNLPPVITGLSGPTTLKVNETGTFTINAYDPENKTLYYLVKWGDEPRYFALDYQGAVAESAVTTQKSSYTHSYAKSGTYTINVEVADDRGNTAKSSITVKVTDVVTNVMKVISPNGGEVLFSGTNSTISWQGASDYVNVYLVRDYNYNCDYNYYYPCVMPMSETGSATSIAMYYQPDILLFSYLPSMANNSVNWVVGNGSMYDYYGGYPYIGDGNYKIKVCTVTTGVCDSSDSSFRITSTYYPRG